MESGIRLSTLCLLLCLGPVAGFGVDPSLQIDVLSELQLGGSAQGVRQVPGLHNGSKAFLFPAKALVLETNDFVKRTQMTLNDL